MRILHILTFLSLLGLPALAANMAAHSAAGRDASGSDFGRPPSAATVASLSPSHDDESTAWMDAIGINAEEPGVPASNSAVPRAHGAEGDPVTTAGDAIKSLETVRKESAARHAPSASVRPFLGGAAGPIRAFSASSGSLPATSIVAVVGPRSASAGIVQSGATAAWTKFI